MARKSLVATRVMDLYYQQFRTNSDFFNKEDFEYYVGVGYGEVLQLEWDKNYALIKRDEGNSDLVKFDNGWLKEIEVKVKRDSNTGWAELPQTVMSFDSDRNNTGIQDVFPVGCTGCGMLVRDTSDIEWQDEYLPVTNKTFFSLQIGRRLRLYNNKGTMPNKIRVVYVPGPDNPDLDIAVVKTGRIIQYTFNLMVQARQGKIVSRVNDRNENKTMQTEADATAAKQPS